MKPTTYSPPLPRPTRPSPGSIWGFVYALLCYGVFQAAFGYLVGFVNDLLVPKGVADGANLGVVGALVVNIGLIVLWGAQHSMMARRSFKERWTRVIPAHTERATYVLASAVALLIVMFAWVPLRGSLWNVQSPVAAALLGAGGMIGWLALLAASFEIDHFDLFGLKQPYLAWKGRTRQKQFFRTKFLYRIVRHPIQSGLLMGMWCTPNMSSSRALFAMLMTLYMLVGLYFEERDLVREFGRRYLQYKKDVPKLIPIPKRWLPKSDDAAVSVEAVSAR